MVCQPPALTECISEENPLPFVHSNTIVKKSLSLQELMIYFRVPYEMIDSKSNITEFIANRLRFEISDVIKTQKFGESPILWTSDRSSRIFLTDFRVMGSQRPDCCAYEIAAKCRVGILLSTQLHEKIINTMCRECSKRLKCTLIPDKMCKLSYLMESYVKFKDK